jgi:hypothetical protein
MIIKTNLFLFLAIATILLSSSLASGNAFAADKDKKDDKNDSNPFKALWDAIAGLQNQINHIQLTPGPPGANGHDGAPGPQGPPGDIGPAGPSGTGHISFSGTSFTLSLDTVGVNQAICPLGSIQIGSMTLDGKLVSITCHYITITP